MTEPFAMTPLALTTDLSLDVPLGAVQPGPGQDGADDYGTGEDAGTGSGQVPGGRGCAVAGTGTTGLLPAVPAGPAKDPLGRKAGVIGAHWAGLFIGAAARRFRNRNSVYHGFLVAPPEAWFAHLVRVANHYWVPKGYKGFWLYAAGWAAEIPCLILHAAGSILIQLSRPWRVLVLIAIITAFTVRACTG